MSRLKSKPALFIIDMQNAFCHEAGSFTQMGQPTSRLAAIIPAIQVLRDRCRTNGIPIFYTRVEFRADYADAGLLLDTLPSSSKGLGTLVRGTWDAQLVEALQPGSGEVVISKPRNSAFFETNLKQLLTERGINQMLLTGVCTNICVESTARDAWNHGIPPLTIHDATATYTDEEQAATLLNLKYYGGSISIQEILEELG